VGDHAAIISRPGSDSRPGCRATFVQAGVDGKDDVNVTDGIDGKNGGPDRGREPVWHRLGNDGPDSSLTKLPN
jgi:hypothetical protein